VCIRQYAAVGGVRGIYSAGLRTHIRLVPTGSMVLQGVRHVLSAYPLYYGSWVDRRLVDRHSLTVDSAYRANDPGKERCWGPVAYAAAVLLRPNLI
jgi:hypothetical protein